MDILISIEISNLCFALTWMDFTSEIDFMSHFERLSLLFPSAVSSSDPVCRLVSSPAGVPCSASCRCVCPHSCCLNHWDSRPWSSLSPSSQREVKHSFYDMCSLCVCTRISPYLGLSQSRYRWKEEKNDKEGSPAISGLTTYLECYEMLQIKWFPK